MFKATLRVGYADGRHDDVPDITPIDLIAFERKFDVPATQFAGETMRLEWMAFVCWVALTRGKKTTAEFDPWLETVASVNPLGDGSGKAEDSPSTA